MGRLLGCRRASELFGRHEVQFSAFDGQQPGHHFSGDCQSGPVAIASLHLLFVDQGQLMVPSRRQLRSFDQHVLDVLIHSEPAERGAVRLDKRIGLQSVVDRLLPDSFRR